MALRVQPSKRIIFGATVTISTVDGWSVSIRNDYRGYLRTAARLRADSVAPFHQRMTALVDARSCEVSSRVWVSLAEPIAMAGAGQYRAHPESADARAASPVDIGVLALSA